MKTIFIVGAPKSGTTLLTQKLISKFELDYVSNLTARFWKKPSQGIKITKKLFPTERKRKFINFKSNFGITEGLLNVHEFGYFWNYWLNPKNSKSQRMSIFRRKKFKKKDFINFINKEIFSYSKKNFIFKNLQCGLNAKILNDVLDCVFIRIKRDESEIFKSLKKEYIKKNIFNSNILISLRPSTYPSGFKNLNGKKKILKQIKDINLDLDEELLDLRVIEIKFKDLIANEKRTIYKIRNGLKKFRIFI